MGIGEWTLQNWFNLFSAIGIMAGMWFTDLNKFALIF